MNTDCCDKRTTYTTFRGKISQVLKNFYTTNHPPSIHEYTSEKIFPVDRIRHYCTVHIFGLFFEVTTARKGSLVSPGTN